MQGKRSVACVGHLACAASRGPSSVGGFRPCPFAWKSLDRSAPVPASCRFVKVSLARIVGGVDAAVVQEAVDRRGETTLRVKQVLTLGNLNDRLHVDRQHPRLREVAIRLVQDIGVIGHGVERGTFLGAGRDDSLLHHLFLQLHDVRIHGLISIHQFAGLLRQSLWQWRRVSFSSARRHGHKVPQPSGCRRSHRSGHRGSLIPIRIPGDLLATRDRAIARL